MILPKRRSIAVPHRTLVTIRAGSFIATNLSTQAARLAGDPLGQVGTECAFSRYSATFPGRGFATPAFFAKPCQQYIFFKMQGRCQLSAGLQHTPSQLPQSQAC